MSDPTQAGDVVDIHAVIRANARKLCLLVSLGIEEPQGLPGSMFIIPCPECGDGCYGEIYVDEDGVSPMVGQCNNGHDIEVDVAARFGLDAGIGGDE